MTSNVILTLLGSDMNNHTKKIEKYVSAEVIGTYFQYNKIRVMCNDNFLSLKISKNKQHFTIYIIVIGLALSSVVAIIFAVLLVISLRKQRKTQNVEKSADTITGILCIIQSILHYYIDHPCLQKSSRYLSYSFRNLNRQKSRAC